MTDYIFHKYFVFSIFEPVILKDIFLLHSEELSWFLLNAWKIIMMQSNSLFSPCLAQGRSLSKRRISSNHTAGRDFSASWVEQKRRPELRRRQLHFLECNGKISLRITGSKMENTKMTSFLSIYHWYGSVASSRFVLEGTIWAIWLDTRLSRINGKPTWVAIVYTYFTITHIKILVLFLMSNH